MPRTLNDLALGTTVYVDETVDGVTEHTPYNLVSKGSTAVLLRRYVVGAKRMQPSNVATYDGCEMDVWLNSPDGFLARFDAATVGALAANTIAYSDYNLTQDNTVSYPSITRSVYLLSSTEMGFGGSEQGASVLDALKIINNTTNNTAARISYNSSETAGACWLRSADSASQFWYVGSNGSAASHNASQSHWFRPALSVALATSVSDEGAESIFLLPEARTTYWRISAVAPVGECAERPAQAKLEIAESGISDAAYYVTNNAGDAEPVWAQCNANGVANLTNTTKSTTNWQLAVKIDAQASTADGYVGESILAGLTDMENAE